MKQIIQNYKTGELQLVEISIPALKKGFVLVQNMVSLVSVGTEKYMLEMAKKSLVGKALARPDLVKQVIAKAKTEGVLEAYKAAMTRLDNPVPLGYSCAGIVIDVGEGVGEFKKWDRVACGGSEYASHAEVVAIPENLCVKIPRKQSAETNPFLSFEEASFVALGGIALQSVRLANLALGDKVAVIGLGLLGQIAVQLLRTAGLHAFGVDISEDKVRMAQDNGAERAVVSGKSDVLQSAREFAPRGFDSVIIMAAAKSNEPLELAAAIARERARIVAAGLVGLDIPRKAFFEKELELVVSRAWGPGIFDPLYTEKNIDYPYAYARWTAKRNMEEFLNQVAKGAVRVSHLITQRFPIEKALGAYDLILKNKEPYLGVLITYGAEEKKEIGALKLMINPTATKGKKETVESNQKSNSFLKAGIIGTGLFAAGILIPTLRSFRSIKVKAVAEAVGIKGHHTAKKFSANYYTTDYKELYTDNDIELIFILTRHGSHARFVIETLRARKHVYVEKPLCIKEDQLKDIVEAYNEIVASQSKAPIIMVGFNRRYSPLAVWLKEKFLMLQAPLSVHCTVNAGFIPPDHWVHDPEEGGGRIVGEVCHFIDLIQYFTGAKPAEVFAESLDSKAYRQSDNVSIHLKMENGALGSILYVAGGDKRFPKERVEIFGGGAVGVIENYRKAIYVSGGKKQTIRKRLRMDLGYKGEMKALFEWIREGKKSVDFEEYVSTTLATFAIERSLQEKRPVKISERKLSLE